jgi:ketosteroid isomerase-like protein
MTPPDTAAVADQLFGAIERGDISALADLWSPDIVVWREGGGRERDKARGLKVIEWFIDATAERRYEVLDRQYFGSPGVQGFLQQHLVHATARNGTPLSFRACLIIRVAPDGSITRIDEYLDPADLAPLTGA